MRKAKIYGALATILDLLCWVVAIIGLLCVYRFFVVDLFSAGSKLIGIGRIVLSIVAIGWLLSAIDSLEEAEDKALDAEYKQVVYSGMMPRGEDEHEAG